MGSLEQQIKTKARQVGFDLAGIAAAEPADGWERLQDWLARGFAGDMAYMVRQAQARHHPASILPQVRSVVMVAMNYYSPSDRAATVREREYVTPFPHGRGSESHVSEAKIARYARGLDYHDVLRARLNNLLAWIQELVPGTLGRGVVDTAPLLERDFARRAGLGWIGKNTMLLNKRLGSYYFLGALLLDLPLQADAPFTANHCGSCTACLDACPTDAFPGPGWLDARRCISYLTIELRGPVPMDLREGLGDWLFGCDICQEVCPWNRKAPAARDPEMMPRADLVAVDPLALFALSDADFRQRFRDTALWRTKRSGLLRNAALVLGNQGNVQALPTLERAAQDPDPVIAEAARWAMETIRKKNA